MVFLNFRLEQHTVFCLLMVFILTHGCSPPGKVLKQNDRGIYSGYQF